MQVSPPELHVVPSETMCEDVSVRLDAVVYGLGCCICDIVSLRAQIAFYYKARVNIPALSDRTVCRDVVASGITTGAEIQVNFHIHVHTLSIPAVLYWSLYLILLIELQPPFHQTLNGGSRAMQSIW